MQEPFFDLTQMIIDFLLAVKTGVVPHEIISMPPRLADLAVHVTQLAAPIHVPLTAVAAFSRILLDG
jgi:hypothetical protein